MFKAIALSICLTSCAAMEAFTGKGPQILIENIKIVAERNMNNNSATPLDLVLVYDEKLLGILLGLTANDYFAKRQQLLKDNSGMMEAISFEMTPSQVLPDYQVKYLYPNPAGAILYANYSTPGEHRVKLAKQKDLLIKLGTLDFTIDPEK